MTAKVRWYLTHKSGQLIADIHALAYAARTWGIGKSVEMCYSRPWRSVRDTTCYKYKSLQVLHVSVFRIISCLPDCTSASAGQSHPPEFLIATPQSIPPQTKKKQIPFGRQLIAELTSVIFIKLRIMTNVTPNRRGPRERNDSRSRTCRGGGKPLGRKGSSLPAKALKFIKKCSKLIK